jgi:hypothetical protein
MRNPGATESIELTRKKHGMTRQVPNFSILTATEF